MESTNLHPPRHFSDRQGGKEESGKTPLGAGTSLPTLCTLPWT